MKRNFDLIYLSTWSNGKDTHSNVYIFDIDADKFYLIQTPCLENSQIDYYLDAGISPTTWYVSRVEEFWKTKSEIDIQDLQKLIHHNNPMLKKYSRNLKINDLIDYDSNTN